MLKPLLRIIPIISGNVNLACYVTDYEESDNNVYESNIHIAKLLPLTNTTKQLNIAANLIGSSWQYDIKRFYNEYSDTFFNNGFNYNTTDIDLLDKTKDILHRNTDFEYGVKRVSYIKNGYQFACFAPIYIESTDDIPAYFLLDVVFKNDKYELHKYLKVNISSTADENDNYLYQYLKRYTDSIDSNVIFMNPDNKSATYYGIDIVNGGFTNKVYPKISNIFKVQLPIQEFDYSIAAGFMNNKLICKQVLPLSFYFDTDNLLTSREKALLKNCTITFSGNYYNSVNGKIDWNDFSFDYDFYNEDILRADEKTGMLSYQHGDLDNLMIQPFPSLNDAYIQKYQFSNKLTTTYFRWKLKYSDDEHPYITNLAWVYSNNQGNNYKYKEYPTTFLPMAGICTVFNDHKKYYFNLILPIGDNNIKIYDESNPLSVPKYNNILNNYCLNWFSISKYKGNKEEDMQSIESENEWTDVVDDRAYYKGILYDLANVYNDSNVKEEDKIDKFGVFTYFDTTQIKPASTIINTMKFADYTLYSHFSTTNIINPNCSVTSGLAYSNSKYLFRDLEEPIDSIEYNNIFTYNESGEGNFIEMSYYNGLDYYELNKYYDADLVDKDASFERIINYDGTDEILASSLYNILGNDYKESSYIVSDALKITYTSSYWLNIPIINSYEVIDISKAYSMIDPLTNLISIFGTTGGSTIDDQNHAYYKNSADGKYYLTYEGKYLTDNLFISKNGGDITYCSTIHNWSLDTEITPISDFVFELPDANAASTIYGNVLYNRKRFINNYYIENLSMDGVISEDFINAYIDSYSNLYRIYDDPWNRATLSYLCNNIIEVYSDLLANNINRLDEYEFNTNKRYGNNTSIATNVFTRHDISIGRTYEQETAAENINKDRNVLYVSKYNIINLLKHFKDKPINRINEVLQDLNDIYDMVNVDKYDTYYSSFYGKVLNKPFLSTWYAELSKDEKRKRMVYTDGTWQDLWYRNIYIQQKVLCHTENGLRAMYKYINIDQFKLKDGFDIKKFDDFYNAIEYVAGKGAFKFNDKYIEYDDYKDIFPYENFLIYIKDKYIRLDDVIFEIMNMDLDNDWDYKDFYVYKTTEVEDIDRLYYSQNSDYDDTTLQSPIEYITPDKYNELMNNSSIRLEDIHNSLTPLYTEYTAQNLEEAEIYEHYQLDLISPVYFGDVTNYRYDMNNSIMMIYVSDEDKEALKKHLGDKPIMTYDNYSETKRYTLYDNHSGDKYGYNSNSKLNVFRGTDGKMYGYYLINMLIDNTYDTFNIKGRPQNEKYTDTLIDDIEANNLKYIQYINGIDITKNPEYIAEVYKIIGPFMYLNPLYLIGNLNTLNKPNIINLNIIYKENKISSNDKNIDNKEYNIYIGDENYIRQKQALQRYMNAIVPWITPRKVIPNLYYRKFKDVKATLLDTGKFNSVGDTVLYKHDSSISSFIGNNIYSVIPEEYLDPSNKEYEKYINIKNYNYVKYIYTPIEYKYYDASVAINLQKEINIKVNGKFKYEELLDLESYDKTLKVFTDYINKNNAFDEDEILFLYSKYKVEYISTPQGLNFPKTDKLYTFAYKFILL